jgi:hypothetical protein
MSDTASKKPAYDDLFSIPENVTGEIVNGKLVATPRHSHVAAALSAMVIPPYRFAEGGGPGGWIILYEPEIMLGEPSSGSRPCGVEKGAVSANNAIKLDCHFPRLGVRNPLPCHGPP